MDPRQIGILVGLAGALLNAFNYALSKDLVEKHGLGGLRQLAAMSAGMLCLTLPLLGASGFYASLTLPLLWAAVLIVAPAVIAQYLLIRLLAYTDSSIVSPLLSLKIPVIALLSLLLFGTGYSLRQTGAILALIALSFVFSSLSGRVRLVPLIVTFFISLGYVLSDLAILYFLSLCQGSALSRSLCCVLWEYALTGALALPLFFRKSLRLGPADIWRARWVTLTTLAAVLCWILCFYLADVVTGNILQSCRCVLGLLVAYAFFRSHIREGGSFGAKLAVALGMFAAIAAYNL